MKELCMASFHKRENAIVNKYDINKSFEDFWLNDNNISPIIEYFNNTLLLDPSYEHRTYL